MGASILRTGKVSRVLKLLRLSGFAFLSQADSFRDLDITDMEITKSLATVDVTAKDENCPESALPQKSLRWQIFGVVISGLALFSDGYNAQISMY